MSIELSYCGEYTQILAYRKPSVPAGLIMLTHHSRQTEHLILVSQLAEYLAQAVPIQHDMLARFAAQHIKGFIRLGDYVIEIVTGD